MARNQASADFEHLSSLGILPVSYTAICMVRSGVVILLCCFSMRWCQELWSDWNSHQSMVFCGGGGSFSNLSACVSDQIERVTSVYERYPGLFWWLLLTNDLHLTVGVLLSEAYTTFTDRGGYSNILWQSLRTMVIPAGVAAFVAALQALVCGRFRFRFARRTVWSTHFARSYKWLRLLLLGLWVPTVLLLVYVFFAVRAWGVIELVAVREVFTVDQFFSAAPWLGTSLVVCGVLLQFLVAIVYRYRYARLLDLPERSS